MIETLLYVILYGTVFCISSLAFLCSVLLRVSDPFPIVYRSKKEETFHDPTTGKDIPLPLLTDPWEIHLSVIVPAFDEEKRIAPMLDECLDVLESRGNDFLYEVIIVSDGSRDKTVEVAQEYTRKYGSKKVRVLKLETNRGKGGAVRLGVLNARGAVLLFADADGATKFGDLSKLEESLNEVVDVNYKKKPGVVAETLGIVCGSRAHLEDEAISSRSAFRTLLMHGFHWLVWLLAVKDIRDTQCGFKLLTRQAAKICFSCLHVEKWAFDVELLYIAQSLNIPITEVAVNWTEIEGSKIVPVLSWLQMGKDLVLIWLRYAIGAWKLSTKYHRQ